MKAVPESRGAFSLIEILVAMAILTMLMAFMFALLGSTIRLWEQGNNQVEAAQAARIGLNRLAEDIQNALAASVASERPGGGAPLTSVVPFLALPDASSAPGAWPGGQFVSSSGSDQVFGVRSTGSADDPFKEFGYLSVFSGAPWVNMRGQRYYLVQHSVSTMGAADFFLRSPSANWISGGQGHRFPIIDNCLRLEILYPNPTNWNSWTNIWTSQTNLPPGALVTVITIDSRTAERVAQLTGGTPLSAADISSITNTAAPNPGLQTLLRNGSVVMRRFIPFRNSR
jgi:prepilin-type N-terminal cleavage/methylation domain-containing protein